MCVVPNVRVWLTTNTMQGSTGGVVSGACAAEPHAGPQGPGQAATLAAGT
jgi:hypothetical protein